MHKRLSYKKKLAVVKELSRPDRPLQKIINAKDPRAQDVPLNDYNSESIRIRSRKRAAKLVERQHTPR